MQPPASLRPASPVLPPKPPRGASERASEKPLWIAHRGGAALRPENTLSAFAGAIAEGADGIEMDVRLSACGTVVVHHDPALNPGLTRLDGRWLTPPTAAIRSLSLTDLRRHDIGRPCPGSAYAAAHPGVQPADGAVIPTLQEVIDLVRALAPETFRLMVEIKTEPDTARRDRDLLCEAVVALLHGNDVAVRSTVISFDWRVLEKVRRLSPELPTSWLTRRLGWRRIFLPRRLQIMAAAGASHWGPWHEDVTRRTLAAAHGRGLKVSCWSVDDADDAVRLAALGVDEISADIAPPGTPGD